MFRKLKLTDNWTKIYKRYSYMFHVVNLLMAIAQYGVPAIIGFSSLIETHVFIGLVCLFSILGIAGSYIKQNIKDKINPCDSDNKKAA